MAIKQYNLKIKDGSDMYWDRPSKISFPEDSYKYIKTRWNSKDYTWNILSYRVYGTTELYWLIMLVNDITDPYGIKDGDEIRVLKPEYINELGVG